jgi:hypothetical protein
VTGAARTNFYFDADGKQVKSIVGGVTTYYVGQHYEKKGATVTKYYFAGAARLAVRTNGTLSFLLGDHLGSSSVTVNASGVKTASALYREASCKDKAFGETRFSSGNLGADDKFTGQREQAELGLYFSARAGTTARWTDSPKRTPLSLAACRAGIGMLMSTTTRSGTPTRVDIARCFVQPLSEL